jgi:hypothetical protein
MNELPTTLFAFSTQIAERKEEDEHHMAVLAQLTFANQVFEGITRVSETGNGICAESLLRTLFETLTSMTILAKHPEKLQDFVDHGRMTELRMMRVIESPALKKRLEKSVNQTDAEFQKLWAKFNERSWHGLSTKEAFGEAEFGLGTYNRYYRRASAIAHGQPYVTVRGGKVRARPTAWKNMSIGAENMAMLMLLTSLEILKREFKLEVDLTEPREKLDAHLKQHMSQIEKMADANPEASA